MSEDEARRLVAQVPHWHHAYEVFPNVTTPGTYAPQFMWDLLSLPDIAGMRVLDLGAADGFFTKRLLDAGAQVTAVDYKPKTATGFWVMERCRGQELDHRNLNVYELNPSELGTFDIVLFLGVIYHLPDMIRALRIVRSLTRTTAFIESYVEEFPASGALARYTPRDTLVADPTNFWAPNVECLTEIARACGLDTVRTERWGDRVLLETKAVSPEPKVSEAMGRAF